MRILVTTIGAAGDHLPVLGVASALAARGHSVLCALDEPWRTRAAGIGLPVAPLGDSAPGAGAQPLEGSLAFLRRRVIPRVPSMVRAIESAARGWEAELILGHHISLGAPWAAQRLGVAWAMASVAPASWTSLEQVTVYPGMPDKDRYSPRVMRFAVGAGKAVTNAMIDPGLNRARRSLGLPPVRGAMFDEMFSGVANLGLWSPEFRPLASDDAPRSVVCGFVEPPDLLGESEASARVQAFVASHGRVTVFTLGTSVPGAAERFFGAAVEWSRRTGRPAVLLTGSDLGAPEPGSASVIAVPFAPLAAVLPRADCVVHHGGLGTIGFALRAGVPMVCVPHLHDQFDNASRCRRLGVSLTVSRRRLGSMGEAIGRVTSDPSFRAAAERVRSLIMNERGAERAAEALERAMGATAARQGVGVD